MLCVKRN